VGVRCPVVEPVRIENGSSPKALSTALGVGVPHVIVALMRADVLKTIHEPLTDAEVRIVAAALSREVRIED